MQDQELDLFKLEPRFFQALVCPQTKSSLQLSKDGRELICLGARCAYPIHDGVPILLADEARDLTEQELQRLK